MLDRADNELVGFDTENSSINPFEDDFRGHGFSIAIKINGVMFAEYFPIAHVRGFNMPEDQWRPILEKVATLICIIHNAKYDVKTVRKMYGILLKRFRDTTKLSHLHDENWGTDHEGNTKRARTLENLCDAYGVIGKVKSFEFQAILAAYGWPRIGSDEIDEYATGDAIAVYELHEEIMKRIEKQGELEDIETYWKLFEEPNFRTLYRMKDLGIKVDIPGCKTMSFKAQVEMEGIQEELGFNPNKPSELGPVLWEQLNLPVVMQKRKNGTETPTLDKSAIEYYEDIISGRIENGLLSGEYAKLASSILEFKGWGKADSSYYDNYIRLADSSSILRPDYSSHGTVTGRYACSKPNLQQIPKESNKVWNGNIKGLFLPVSVEHELWEFDYSQLEFRLGAHFSKEPKLLDVFNDAKRDVFNEMAADLGLTRQQCKTLTYSINYGAGAKRIMDVFGYSRPKAMGVINDFYDNYPKLHAANKHIEMLASRRGKVQLWSGRWRHIPNKKDARKAFNSYIQGGGADIVKHVMNRCTKEAKHIPMHLQIHDSLVFSLRKDNIEEEKNTVLSIMNDPTIDLGIKWDVDLKAAGNKLGEDH